MKIRKCNCLTEEILLIDQALKTLRSAEYAPYVVFIAAPCLQTMQDYDGSLEKLARESDALKQVFFVFFMRNFTTHVLITLHTHVVFKPTTCSPTFPLLPSSRPTATTLT